MSVINVETADSHELAYERANYFEQQDGFSATVYGPGMLTVDCFTMPEGSLTQAGNHYLIVAVKS